MLIVQGSYSQATRTRRLWTACSTSSSTTTGTTWERCSDQNHCIHKNHHDYDHHQHHHCKITRTMFYRIAPLVSCRSPSFHQTVISSARKWLLGINPIKSAYHHPVYSNYLHYNISCQSLSTLLRSFLSFLKQPALGENSNVTTVQLDLMPHNSIQAFPSFCLSPSAQSAKN